MNQFFVGPSGDLKSDGREQEEKSFLSTKKWNNYEASGRRHGELLYRGNVAVLPRDVLSTFSSTRREFSSPTVAAFASPGESSLRR
jgi:hypothetical protein